MQCPNHALLERLLPPNVRSYRIQRRVLQGAGGSTVVVYSPPSPTPPHLGLTPPGLTLHLIPNPSPSAPPPWPLLRPVFCLHESGDSSMPLTQVLGVRSDVVANLTSGRWSPSLGLPDDLLPEVPPDGE
jgi:hypothetical protein